MSLHGHIECPPQLPDACAEFPDLGLRLPSGHGHQHAHEDGDDEGHDDGLLVHVGEHQGQDPPNAGELGTCALHHQVEVELAEFAEELIFGLRLPMCSGTMASRVMAFGR